MTLNKFGKHRTIQHAIWWITDPIKGVDKKLTRRRKNDAIDFFKHFSLHGYSKLLSASLFERSIWVVVHIVSFVMVVIAMSYIWADITGTSLQMRHEDPNYPIDLVPFPAITLCPHTRFSLRRVRDYATLLSQRDPENRTMEFFMEKIQYFRVFFMNDEIDISISAVNEFRNFLELYGSQENSTSFNMRHTLLALAQPCVEFINACRIGINNVSCFSEQTIVTSYTTEGICCTFNSLNRFENRVDYEKQTKSEFLIGFDLYHNESDNAFTNLNNDGYALHIHDPSNIVNTMSGGVHYVIPNHGELWSIGIKATQITTDEVLRKYNAKQRGCFYNGEHSDKDYFLAKNYTYSNCILKCMVHHIRTICGCTPFYIDKEIYKNTELKPYCNIGEAYCISSHSFKFSSILSSYDIDNLNMELELEKVDGMDCRGCLPLCDYAQFQASVTNTVVLSNNQNISSVEVRFKDSTALLLKYVETNTWNQTLSTFGSVTSIILGFSMVAIFEILYYLFKYMRKGLKAYFSLNQRSSSQVGYKIHDKPLQKELIICP